MRFAVVISTDPARANGVEPAFSVAGKPMIVRAIETARACRSVDIVCAVSTDSKVLALARTAGAVAVEQAPQHFQSDYPAPTALIRSALNQLQSECGALPDGLLWISPSHPLVEGADWEEAAELLRRRSNVGFVFAAIEVPGPLWSNEADGDTFVPLNAPCATRPLGKLLIDAGAFYAFRTKALISAKVAQDRALPHILARERALEIRTSADFQAAEFILRERERNAAALAIPRPLGAIVFDFDGVFTDNRVVVFQDGREAALCDRADGWGLSQLKKKLAVPILVLSTERNPIVRARCEKLRIECINDVPDKLVVLREWLARRQINPASVVYLGNDVNDLSCMREIGCPVAVADAYPQVKAASRIVLSSAGGKGAVREMTELVAAALELATPEQPIVSTNSVSTRCAPTST